jgi:iron-regulated transporter 1
MRRIDLTCLIASPIMAGLLLTYSGLQAAILAIMAWNVAAWLPECLLLSYAQRHSPVLRCARRPASRTPAQAQQLFVCKPAHWLLGPRAFACA